MALRRAERRTLSFTFDDSQVSPDDKSDQHGRRARVQRSPRAPAVGRRLTGSARKTVGVRGSRASVRKDWNDPDGAIIVFTRR